ncbi:unnamed protein product [Brassica oleracea]
MILRMTFLVNEHLEILIAHAIIEGGSGVSSTSPSEQSVWCLFSFQICLSRLRSGRREYPRR